MICYFFYRNCFTFGPFDYDCQIYLIDILLFRYYYQTSLKKRYLFEKKNWRTNWKMFFFRTVVETFCAICIKTGCPLDLRLITLKFFPCFSLLFCSLRYPYCSAPFDICLWYFDFTVPKLKKNLKYILCMKCFTYRFFFLHIWKLLNTDPNHNTTWDFCLRHA